ncbi:TMEM43 family protein, partial [Devosia sp.]|uniref:TMEM43 family protein n=1 Tax=Devosia sp. TaxID=1871048 RepID=UPI001AD25E40
SQTLVLGTDQAQAVQDAIGAGIRASIVNGGIYLGNNSASPQLGDYRISYEYIPVDTISIIGKQQGAALAPYRTESGDSLLMVDTGTVTAADMFEGAASGNATMTWIIRIAGLALLIAGFGAVLGPVSVLASVLPFLGSILGFGTGIIAGAAGLGVGSLTIGSAWLFYRPLLALAIFAIAGLIIGGLVFIGRRKKASATVQPAA